MPLLVNGHVEKLHKYQPFDADSGDLVFEQQSTYDQPMFKVETRGFLERLVKGSAIRLIVLTGDAGHGKTSLCAALLEDLGASPAQAALSVEEYGLAGESPAGQTSAGRPIYIIKDLSEFKPEVGATHLNRLLQPQGNGIAVVCANEGQLRSCVAADTTEESRVIVETLSAGVSQGAVKSADGIIAVINLNYQSVAPTGRPGLLDWALGQWAVDRRSWQICKRCDAQSVCPIWANHEALSDKAAGPRRRDALRDLFGAAETTGAVITTRQALSAVSYAVTGGIRCADVHKKYSRDPTSVEWQSAHLYNQALFGDMLSPRQREQVPVILALRRLDPGWVSRREVDDYLDPDSAQALFLPPQPGVEANSTRTLKQLREDAKLLRRLYAFLRRVDFFDAEAGTRYPRLGISAGDQFMAIQGEIPDADKTVIRDTLLKGLEAVQGVHRVGRNPDFLVLDPAFYAHRARASVVAQTVTNRDVQLMDQLSHWNATAQKSALEPELQSAVEWSNRAVFVRIPLRGQESTVSVELNLLRFELLTRWAGGLRSGAQHEAEIRGLTNSLAALSDGGDEGQDIQVLVGSIPRKLTIDVGNQIRSVRT